MILNIDKSHSIFKSVSYQKDIVPFNLMEMIKQSPELLISDGKNFIIGRSSPKYQAWIWTIDNISRESLLELSDYYYNQFNCDNPVHFTAKKEIAFQLKKRFLDERSADVQCMSMESFECQKLIPAKNTIVTPERPNDKDINQVTECLKCFFIDCFGTEPTYQDCLEDAKIFILNSNSHLIKYSGTVVAIASSTRETDTHVAISHVYTRPEYRCKGFAALLVAHISKIILDNNKIPMLYTDLSNPASNKAYKNIGFVECGKVYDITMTFN